MSLGDSDIEEAIRIRLGEAGRTCTAWHRSSDGDEPGILACQLHQPLPERRSVSRVRYRDLALLAGGRIVSRRKCVPFLDVLAGGKALPFLGDAVNQARPAHVAHRG